MFKNLLRALTPRLPYTCIAFDRVGDFILEQPCGIFTIKPDGSDCHRVRETGTGPIWSPDGKWIAFLEKVADNSHLNSIFLMRPDGQQVRRVSFDYDVEASRPSWSPDSKQLVYELWLWEEKQHQICVLDIQSGQTRKLLRSAYITYPTWKSLNEIVFNKCDLICSISPDGRNERECKLFERGDSEVKWSLDGSRVLFRRGEKLCVMNADGNDLQTVPTQGRIPEFAISPDGANVVYARSDGGGKAGFEIHITNLDGTDARKLVANPYWRNKSTESYGVSWSPWLQHSWLHGRIVFQDAS